MAFTDWWRKTSLIFKVVVSIFLGISAISAGASAWIAQGWWTPASRAYVKEEVAKIAGPLLSLAVEQRNRIRRGRDDLIARRAQSKDDQIRSDLQALIEQADRDIILTEGSIAVLDHLRQ